MYVLGTVALIKKTEGEMVELKMLRFPLGMTRSNKIINEYLRRTGQVKQFRGKARDSRLR